MTNETLILSLTNLDGWASMANSLCIRSLQVAGSPEYFSEGGQVGSDTHPPCKFLLFYGHAISLAHSTDCSTIMQTLTLLWCVKVTTKLAILCEQDANFNTLTPVCVCALCFVSTEVGLHEHASQQ